MRDSLVTVSPEAALLKIEYEHIEPPLGCYLRIKLAQRTRRRVARIRHKRFALRLALRVYSLKNGARHIDLAADSDVERLGKRHGDRKYRPYVLRYVLADIPVAARRTAHKNAVLVCERDRKSVYLRLHRPLGHDICLGEPCLGAVEICRKLFKRKNIRKRVQRNAVRHLFKPLKRRTAHTLSR